VPEILNAHSAWTVSFKGCRGLGLEGSIRLSEMRPPPRLTRGSRPCIAFSGAFRDCQHRRFGPPTSTSMRTEGGIAIYLSRRVGAFVTDMAVVWIAFAALEALPSFHESVVLNALLYLVYRSIPGSLMGKQTLGRHGFRLEVLSNKEGQVRPSLAQLIVREAPMAAVLLSPLAGLPLGLFLLFGVGPLVPLLDLIVAARREDRRGWRDLVAGTRVVDASAGSATASAR